MSWMCEIKERMLWLDRARTIQVTEGDDVDFSKKNFLQDTIRKVVDCGASLRESSVKNLGSALLYSREGRKKSPISVV